MLVYETKVLALLQSLPYQAFGVTAFEIFHSAAVLTNQMVVVRIRQFIVSKVFLEIDQFYQSQRFKVFQSAVNRGLVHRFGADGFADLLDRQRLFGIVQISQNFNPARSDLELMASQKLFVIQFHN